MLIGMNKFDSNLKTYFEKNNVGLHERLIIFLQINLSLKSLHNHKIIHRDIKSHNIFITEPSPGHFVAKIGDWGSARAVALTGV